MVCHKRYENRQEIVVGQGVAISVKVREENRVTSVFFLVFFFTR